MVGRYFPSPQRLPDFQLAMLKGRPLGVAIAVAGMLMVTPDAALLRVQASAGGTTPVITVWRYIMAGTLSCVITLASSGSATAVLNGVRPAPVSVLFASFLMLLTNIGFTVSLLKCDAAKALLLISLNPLWAALMGYVLLGDKLPRRTIIAQVLSLISTFIMLAPSLLAIISPVHRHHKHTAESGGSGGLGGGGGGGNEDESGGGGGPDELLDLIPLLTGIAQASLLIFVRAASIRCPDASMDAVPALGAYLTSIFSVAMAAADEGDAWSFPSSLLDGLRWPFWAALVGCGLGLASYNAACTIAPRYLTGAEVALVLLGESVGGPLWVFLAFGDVPSVWTLASGALLIATLIGHEVAGMMAPADDELDDTKAEPLMDASRNSSLTNIAQSPLLGAHSLCASPPPSERGAFLLPPTVATKELLHVGVGASGGYVPPKA